MKKWFHNLLTLPYRFWLLQLGHNCWCNECHTIVSGGFGGFKAGRHYFACVTCADNDYINRQKLSSGWKYDPCSK